MCTTWHISPLISLDILSWFGQQEWGPWIFFGMSTLRICQPIFDFRAQQSNTRNVFWEPCDDHNQPSSSDLQSLKITLLVCF